MRFIKLLIVLAFMAALGMYYFVYVMSGQATTYFVNHERKAAKLVRHEITLPDGMHYVYLDGGHGEPLILLHGFGADKDSFTRVAKHLTEHYHVIIPDLLGFGESSHPLNVDYSSRAQAERVRALAQALDITSVHLGGNSMGGQIALSYAAAHPAEVQSLWLLDPAGIWSAPQSELAKVLDRDHRNPLIVRNEDDYVHAMEYAMSKPPYIPKPILHVMAQTSIKNVALSERIFLQISNDSIESKIKGLKTPTLIIWGDQDRVIHVLTAEVLYNLLPKSKVNIMKGIGHMPMLENPEECANDYEFFRFRLITEEKNAAK